MPGGLGGSPPPSRRVRAGRAHARVGRSPRDRPPASEEPARRPPRAIPVAIAPTGGARGREQEHGQRDAVTASARRPARRERIRRRNVSSAAGQARCPILCSTRFTANPSLCASTTKHVQVSAGRRGSVGIITVIQRATLAVGDEPLRAAQTEAARNAARGVPMRARRSRSRSSTSVPASGLRHCQPHQHRRAGALGGDQFCQQPVPVRRAGTQQRESFRAHGRRR